jgi:TrmH family RNA methyltransferase
MLAVGSEAHGLSRRILDQADHRVRIPHSRNVESLNAAVAGSVIMRQVYDLSEG